MSAVQYQLLLTHPARPREHPQPSREETLCACLSPHPAPSQNPWQPLTQLELLFPPKAPRSLRWLVAMQALSLKAPEIPATLPNPSHPLGPWPHSPAPFRWIISERMERASSEALSVMQEAARLRKDTLSSSDNAQDCGDTQWAQMDPRLQGRSGPVPSRPLLCCELTPQPRQKLL